MSMKQWSSPPAMQIDLKKAYRANIETNRGVIEIALYPEYAPKTVNNFVFWRARAFTMVFLFTG